MSHTEFDAVDGKYPQVSDFGRVLLWDGPNRGRRYKPKPKVGEEYSYVKINDVSFKTASLVLNAFEGAPEDGETAVSLRSPPFCGHASASAFAIRSPPALPCFAGSHHVRGQEQRQMVQEEGQEGVRQLAVGGGHLRSRGGRRA